MLALAESQASILNLTEDRFVPCLVPPGQESQFIALAAAHILAMAIIATLSPKEALLVHEADPIVAYILSSRAAERNVEVTHTKSNGIAKPPWVCSSLYLSAYAQAHDPNSSILLCGPVSSRRVQHRISYRGMPSNSLPTGEHSHTLCERLAQVSFTSRWHYS